MKIEELLIDESVPAIEAMRRLDEAGRRILFVAPDGVLKAVLTDSDIRRYILRGGDLALPVSNVANYSPRSLPLSERARARQFLAEQFIDAVPLLDKAGRIAGVVFQNEFDDVRHAAPVTAPVVIMAGGAGTRLYPYTKILPKPLIPIGDNPILEHVIERFCGFGCADFTLILNHKRNMIKSYFADTPHGYTLRFAEEDKPLGTGGGLCLLKGVINETFFLTNCDILIDADYADILNFHQKNGHEVTIVCAAKHYTIPYGVVELDEAGRLAAFSEKPEMNFLTNTGMYVVNPGVLDEIEDDVHQGFPDIITRCREKGASVGVYPISERSWMDMGQLEELEEMRERLEQS